MSLVIANSMYPEPLRSLAFGFINDVSYTTLGSSFVNPIRIMHLQNLTDTDITVSWDGVDDHLLVAAGGFILFDITANKDQQSIGFFFPSGTRLFVRSVSGDPTMGIVTLATFYGRS